MTHDRSSLRRLMLRAVPLAVAAVAALPLAFSQMHKVATPDQVTRAVGVYEYIGDPLHPKAARLIPVSLFIGGHFEDAGIYLARPVPFAIQSGLRYELQKGGVQQNFLDVVAARNFSGSSVAATVPFDDGWFAYGHVVPPTVARTPKLKPNCNPSTARVVQETDNSKKDDSKPKFGKKPAEPAEETKAPEAKSDSGPRFGRRSAPDPCQEDDPTEHITLADDSPKDKNTPDPERPTLHRSPETTANNTGSTAKPDKKAPKPPPATVTANSGPADDLDRPKIRHRTTDEDDPNSLPPDPLEYVSRSKTAKGKDDVAVTAAHEPAAKADGSAVTNTTVDDGGTISAGTTMSGGPVLRRGRVSAPPPEPATAKSTTTLPKPAAKGGMPDVTAASAIPAPLDSLVAVSDAKERVAHDFHYNFANNTERATIVNTLEEMARAVLANPALATDAPSGAVSVPNSAATSAANTAPTRTAATRTVTTRATARSGVAARSHAVVPPTPAAAPGFADEEVSAFQLYFSAPITYTFTARMPSSGSTPERYVTIVAQTDAEGRLQPAMRSVTDAAHLDRTPRYRLIDVVDADASNRASLLMELRMQNTRQFALYRLLGNKPDQVFVSGTTLL
ncbi:hypothetical protein [Terriglobus roseus]|nr:hypothetical protein [Terriglobus roseus]